MKKIIFPLLLTVLAIASPAAAYVKAGSAEILCDTLPAGTELRFPSVDGLNAEDCTWAPWLQNDLVECREDESGLCWNGNGRFVCTVPMYTENGGEADYVAHLVQFDRTGRGYYADPSGAPHPFPFSFPSWGRTPGPEALLSNPLGIDADPFLQVTYVADSAKVLDPTTNTNRQRIVVLGPDLRFSHEILLPTNVGLVNDVAALPAGQVAFTDTNFGGNGRIGVIPFANVALPPNQHTINWLVDSPDLWSPNAIVYDGGSSLYVATLGKAVLSGLDPRDPDAPHDGEVVRVNVFSGAMERGIAGLRGIFDGIDIYHSIGQPMLYVGDLGKVVMYALPTYNLGTNPIQPQVTDFSGCVQQLAGIKWATYYAGDSAMAGATLMTHTFVHRPGGEKKPAAKVAWDAADFYGGRLCVMAVDEEEAIARGAHALFLERDQVTIERSSRVTCD